MSGWADWTGPADEDLADVVMCVLRAPVPSERWPFGPPIFHDAPCRLHAGGLYCDCVASAATGHDGEDAP